MKEMNRDIFEQALNDLPRREAGGDAWTGITAGLDQLDASRFVGQNKGRLPVHRAPAAVWKGIEQGLRASFWSGTAGLMVKIGSVVVLSAAVVTAVLLLSHGKDATVPDVEADPARMHQEQQAVVQEEAESRMAELPEARDVKEQIFPEPATERTDAPETAPMNHSNSLSSGPLQDNRGEREHSRVTTVPEGVSVTPPVRHENLHTLSSLGFVFRDPGPIRIPMRETAGRPPARDDYYKIKQGFDISLGLQVGWMQYSGVDLENMELPAAVPSIGLDLLLEKDRFYLKTGLSYASWEETAGYEFSYNRNELVYSYNYVDSAWFDPSTSQVSYFTTEQDVYDSVFYTRPDEIVNRYRILQVPLEFGYQLVESNRWMIGLHAGPGVDINIGNQTFTPEFADDQASLLGVKDHMIYRPALNWRLAAGAVARYRFTRRLSLYLEPAYHTYLNTVYPGANSSNVSYFQLKFGILYKF